jgi:hypothetical protein
MSSLGSDKYFRNNIRPLYVTFIFYALSLGLDRSN